MSDVTRIQLVKSEIAVPTSVYQSATSILVAYINNKMVTDANQNEMLSKAVKIALELAITTDKLVKATNTMRPGL
jgi:hypothetical protein